VNECRRYAIHIDGTPGHAQDGPVGIWNENGEPYYPESAIALQAKGVQVIAMRAPGEGSQTAAGCRRSMHWTSL
jgi:hypothetical protein